MKQELEELGFEREFNGWFLYLKNNKTIKVCIDIEDVYLCNELNNTQILAFKYNLTKLKQFIKLCK